MPVNGALPVAAMSVGRARRCFDYAVDYAAERKQFGQPIAKYQGVGTNNGSGNYGFMVTVVDDGKRGDTFRIKIWDNDNSVVYDNQIASGDDSYDGTVIEAGNIRVHSNRANRPNAVR